MKNHWVMDYETLVNCFLGVFEHYKTDEVKVFTIGLLRNDLPQFLQFLKQNHENNEWHISFNGLAFDAQITQFIIVNAQKLLQMTGEEAGTAIYIKAQDCITRSNEKQWQEWSENRLTIKQIDLFKLNHWDNAAKRSSLKSIQVAMDWHNVQDMPIEHTTSITTVEQLKEVASYCRNDVSSTKEIMKRCSGEINLRGTLTQKYGIGLFSASETKIAKELFLMFLSHKMEIPPFELKKMRTKRERIEFKDIILPYINFDGLPVFEELLEKFKALSLDPLNTKGAFSPSVKHRGIKIDYGLGGIHAAKKGVYAAKEGMTIMSSDVVSFYPRNAMVNEWAPAHLPKKVFCEQYQWFFDERVKIPKKNPINYVYKIILNGTFGLSNEKDSFLYDPQFLYQVTANGQLDLTLLYIMLTEGLKGAVPLMLNTDGLEMIIPETEKKRYLEICEEWEVIVGLKLEHDEYQKLFIPDVNTYIGVFKYREVDEDSYHKLQEEYPENPFKEEDGKFFYAPTKSKGRFDYVGLALHKNKSFLIVRKAIFHYLIHDTKPEDFLKENRNIFDYCGAVKIKGDWKFIETKVTKSTYKPDASRSEKIKRIREYGFYEVAKDFWRTPEMQGNMAGAGTDQAYEIATRDTGGEVIKDELQKTVRYYISKTGSKIIKVNKMDGRIIQTESGPHHQTVFNVYEDKPWEEYNIDDKYYLQKIYKEIKNLMPERFDNQVSLF